MKRRVTIAIVATLLAFGAVMAYSVSRLMHWHDQGIAGLTYWPLNQAGRKAKAFGGIQPGSVYMLYPSAPAQRAGLQPNDLLISINGVPVANDAALAKLNSRIRRNDALTYRVRRGKETRDFVVRMGSPLRTPMFVLGYLVSGFVAFAFVAIGLLVIARKSDDPRVLVFYAMVLAGAFSMILGPPLALDSASLRGIVSASSSPNFLPLAVLIVAAIAFLPLTLHLALIFPRERPIVRNSPRVLGWVYGIPVAGIVTVLSAISIISVAQKGDAAIHRIVLLLNIASGIVTLAGLAVALRIARRGRTEGTRLAFWNRPVQSLFVVAAVLLGFVRITDVIGIKWIEIVAVSLLFALPCLAIISFPVLTIISLYRSYRDAGAEERRQVKWPLWGTLIALGIRLCVGLLTQGIGITLMLSGGNFSGWISFAQILEILSTFAYLLIPISFAFAILKYRLMNIDIIIRKTVAYAFLTGAIIVMYLVLVGGIGTLLVSVAGVRNQTMVIASTLVVALVVVPLRNKLQTLVDRNLFPHKYDYPAALRAIAADTLQANDLSTFLTSAAEKTQHALQNRAIAIFVTRNEEFVAASKVGLADSVIGSLRMRRAPLLPLDRPFDPTRHALPDDAAAAMKRMEAVLIVPINTPGTPANGFIGLASKLNGNSFDVEDIDFLRGVADQVDIGIDRIRQQREGADYEQARAIQESLLPREMPRVAGLELSGTWQPARTMGGDYYDVLKLSESELAVCIGDVAGKGMSAALLMSGLQAAVRASASGSPRDLCERVRRVVVSSLTGGRFVTFFYATIDTASMRLRWCNAGHNAPVLMRADGSIERLSDGGPAFSRLLRNDAYTEKETTIAVGDRLVLFTDGVSEAAGGDGEMFGEQRIEELVIEHRQASAEELQQRIADAATNFSGGELADDLTLVVIAL